MWFNLFPSVILTPKHDALLLFDLHRQTISGLPLEVETLFEALSYKPIAEVQLLLGDAEGVNVWVERFVANGWGCFSQTKLPKCPLPPNWASPWALSSCTIGWGKESDYDIKGALSELETLGCQGIQLVLKEGTNWETALPWVEQVKIGRCHTVHLYAFADELPSVAALTQTLQRHVRLSQIHFRLRDSDLLNSANEMYASFAENPVLRGRVRYSLHGKQQTPQPQFSISIKTYTESTVKNAGLNQRLAIDTQGFIKNILSHETILGKIGVNSLTDILSNERLQKAWNTPKSQIAQCSSCAMNRFCLDTSEVYWEEERAIAKTDCGARQLYSIKKH